MSSTYNPDYLKYLEQFAEDINLTEGQVAFTNLRLLMWLFRNAEHHIVSSLAELMGSGDDENSGFDPTNVDSLFNKIRLVFVNQMGDTLQRLGDSVAANREDLFTTDVVMMESLEALVAKHQGNEEQTSTTVWDNDEKTITIDRNSVSGQSSQVIIKWDTDGNVNLTFPTYRELKLGGLEKSTLEIPVLAGIINHHYDFRSVDLPKPAYNFCIECFSSQDLFRECFSDISESEMQFMINYSNGVPATMDNFYSCMSYYLTSGEQFRPARIGFYIYYEGVLKTIKKVRDKYPQLFDVPSFGDAVQN